MSTRVPVSTIDRSTTQDEMIFPHLLGTANADDGYVLDTLGPGLSLAELTVLQPDLNVEGSPQSEGVDQ